MTISPRVDMRGAETCRPALRLWFRALFGCRVISIIALVALSLTWCRPDAAQNPSMVANSKTSDNSTGERPTPLSLQLATDLLIKNNLSLLAARYNVDILRAQRIAAGLRPHPNLTFEATQFTIPRVFKNPREFFKTNEEGGAANTSYTVEVDQLIERGNKRELRLSQAELNTQAAEAKVKDVLRQQIFQLRQAFFTAVLARENLLVARENLDHFTRTEKILTVQVNEGYSAGVDLKRVQLQALQFQNDVNNAAQNYQQSLRDVLNLIGNGDAPSSADALLPASSTTTPSTLPGLDGSLDVLEGNLDIVPTLLWIDDLRHLALANRSDVKAAELAVAAARQGVALAEAQRARDITIGAQYSRNGSDNTAGLVLGVPLGTQRFANAAIAEATATKLQAEAQLRAARTQALTDVEKAFTAYNVSRERLRLFTGTALRTASDVRRIEEIAYRDGAKGLLDYLDAQRTYNQMLVDYNQSRFDFLMSLYQLEQASETEIMKR